MNMRESLIAMLNHLESDMSSINQVGAGYYSCEPFQRRFNKLLEQARKLFAEDNSLISTFEDLHESEPKDPGEKWKVLQGIKVEIGQLVTLLESTREESK